MCFVSGDTELMVWKDNELLMVNTEKSEEHETGITGIDVLENYGLFVTGGKDGIVKIWNYRKELIREIKFPESINAVAFLNEKADLLVGHVEKVSQVGAPSYKPRL